MSLEILQNAFEEKVSGINSSLDTLGASISRLIERNTMLENMLAEAERKIAELTAENGQLAKELSAADQALAAIDAGHGDHT